MVSDRAFPDEELLLQSGAMKQRCPQCEAWSAEDVEVCRCGRPLNDRRPARIYRSPTESQARVHRYAVVPDPSYVNTLRKNGDGDVREGMVTIAILLPVTAILALGGEGISWVAILGLFPDAARIVRGFRLRREACEAENIGAPR